MNNTTLYFLILPLVALLIAGGFAACWQWCRTQRDLLWMAGCFALFGTGVASQITAIPAALDTNAVLSAALYHASVWCQAEAMTHRFRIPMQRSSAALVALVSIGLLSYYAFHDDQLFIRIYLLNFGLAVQLLLSTRQLWQAPVNTLLERWLRRLFGIFVLSFFVRTWLTMPQQEGLTAQTFAFTTFWVVLQLSLLAFALLFAMLYLAMAVQEVLHQLQEERNRDPLTQLLNRRAFYEAVQRVHTTGALGTVLLCDIDHFKRINDRWGHATGDAALCHAAQLLARHVRSSDVIARYGGEEFIVLLPGLPLHHAAQLTERLRLTLAQAPLELEGRRHPITASFGLAAVPSLAQLPQAIAHADQQLYAAKAAGRNCVRFSHSPSLQLQH